MRFKNILYKLNIKEDETKKISLLLIQSVFIGIFIAFYYSFVNGLFLKTFSIEMLPVAYVLSGSFGFFATFIFSKVQKKFNVSKVMSGLFLSIVILLSIFKFSLYLYGDQKTIVFFIFICFLPISTLTAIGFGAMTIKFFDLRQGKRLFPIISAGEVISSLVAFISIPVLLSFFVFKNDDTSFLLYFSISGAILALIFQLFMDKRYQHLFNQETSFKKSNKIGLRVILNNKYYLSIIILSIVSILSFMFVDFSFFKFSRDKFLDKRSLTAFLGFFFALIKSTEFIFKTFISGRLIEKYGLKFGLGILPIVLLPITLCTLCVILLGFSNSMVFIFIAINMLLALVLKKSFEDPTFNLLFQPLDSITKISVQTLVSGKARLIGVVLAGIILLIISNFQNYILIITLLLMLALCYWIFIVNKVALNFKSLISFLLKEKRGQLSKEILDENYSNSFSLLKEKEKSLLQKYFINWLIPGYKQIDLLDTNFNGTESLDHLINSKNHNDTLNALLKINNNWDVRYVPFVCLSALSSTAAVSKTAISLLSSKKIDTAHIDDYLNSIVNPSWSFSMFFLISMGCNYSKTIQKIDANFEKDSANFILKKLKEISLIQVLKENKNTENIDFYFTKLRTSDSEIERHLLNNILTNKITFTAAQKALLKAKIDIEARHYSWVLVSILDLGDRDDFKELNTLLLDELESTKNKLYVLLGLLYKATEIKQIKIALNRNESHEIVLAIEMLENILDEAIKDFIIPIYDTLEIKSKYNKLAVFFPQMRMSSIKRLENITNYDFKRSLDFLRVVALKKIGQLHEGTSTAILSHLFNHNVIIKKAAYASLFKNNKEAYFKYYELENDLSFKESLTFFNSNKRCLSIDEKVELLFKNEFFPDTPKMLLFKIAYFSELNLDNKSENKILKETDSILFILSGEIKLIRSGEESIIVKENNILGLKDDVYDGKTEKLIFSENIKYLQISASHLQQILLTEPLLVASLL